MQELPFLYQPAARRLQFEHRILADRPRPRGPLGNAVGSPPATSPRSARPAPPAPDGRRCASGMSASARSRASAGDKLLFSGLPAAGGSRSLRDGPRRALAQGGRLGTHPLGLSPGSVEDRAHPLPLEQRRGEPLLFKCPFVAQSGQHPIHLMAPCLDRRQLRLAVGDLHGAGRAGPPTPDAPARRQVPRWPGRTAPPPSPASSGVASAPRTSCSTADTRSRFTRTFSSLACARSRRFLYWPRPAASSTKERRVCGVELTSSSTFPWLMTLCISRPSPAPATNSWMSSSRHAGTVQPVFGRPIPQESPRDLHLGVVDGEHARVFSKTRATSATAPGRCPSEPEKMTSCMLRPRRLVGLCSPSAQRTPSAMLLFPLPLGPMMTVTPGSNSRSVVPREGLEPFQPDRTQKRHEVAPEDAPNTPSPTNAAWAARCSLFLMLRPMP